MASDVTDFSNMFSVMPMNQRFLLTPGETYEGSITVVNPADATSDFTYKAEVTPYGVLGSDYTADLSTVTNQSEIVNWITIENPTGTIAPNSTAKINFKITVPESAAGGGQYATIAVSSAAQEISSGDGVTVGNIFEMASIIYGYVEGEISHEGQITANTIPGYSAQGNIQTTIGVTNSGNVHEDATIRIKATNIFTNETLLPTDTDTGEYTELIMPGTERYLTEEIDNLPFLGVVHVEQTVYYLGMSSTEYANVIICPIWFLVLVIATIAALITGVVRIILKHKRKKADLAI